MSTEAEFPDAVTFLQSLERELPDVKALLTTDQLKALDLDPNAPLNGDVVNESFVKLADGYFTAKISVESVQSQLRGELLDAKAKEKQVDVARQRIVISVLREVADRLQQLWTRVLAATEKERGEKALPRIIRLSRRFALTEKETKAMVYPFCNQVSLKDRLGGRPRGMLPGYGFGAGSNDVLSICRICDMRISEVVEFLTQTRVHMQQGIFPDVQQMYLLHSTLNYDEVYCKALIGAPLSPNEFLKLDQTFLADIILEEEGNEHLRDDAHVNSPLDSVPPVLGTKDGAAQLEGLHVPFFRPFEAAKNVRPEMTQLLSPAEDSEERTQDQKPAGKETADVSDLDQLLKSERKREKEGMELPPPEEEEMEKDRDKLTPYRTDLEYLDDYFQLIAQKLKVKSMESRIEMEAQIDDELHDTRTLRLKREAETKAKVLRKRCEKRLALTRQAGPWIPRLERMVQSRGLQEFEKNILLTLIGFIIQPNKILPGEGLYGMMGGGQAFTVGEVLRLFCSSLKEQIKHRMFFYKTASLVREGMVIVHSSGLNGDPTSAKIEIDRRMLDFCVGLDTEFSEIVEGSHLYYPQTKFSQVVLSKEQKQLILNTVSNFEAFKRCRKRMGLDDAITYGAGMVMLFHGSPGTGKTMMANALANKLGKKVLLINFPSLGSMSAGENFKFIFREAKINDAILFFDECEAIFETREKGSHDVNMLLTEIERHDGLIIMATNRPYDLDEAMHRRIMIAIEFRQPDYLLRKAIWETHIPEEMKLAEDANINELALRFELTGGFIKNAILSALSIAVSRDGESPLVSQKDLLQGANLQLRGRLRMKDFDRRVIPKSGLDKVIIGDDTMKSLREIVQFEKARSVLFGQWGFGASEQQGLTVLLHGASGTGKTLSAEAIGYEVGKPLKVVNCGELLSKWVGESTKNIDAIFEEARHTDAILVFDEAEGLFGQRTTMSTSTDRYANVDVGVLLYHIERFPGIIILTTNIIDNIDKAFFRRLKFVLHFGVPSYNLRAKLWRLLIPEETPLADGIDFRRLSNHEMTGGNIKSAIFRAASRAALRSEKERVLKMDDLEEAADEEVGKSSTMTSFRRQDSSTANMYN